MLSRTLCIRSEISRIMAPSYIFLYKLLSLADEFAEKCRREIQTTVSVRDFISEKIFSSRVFLVQLKLKQK